MLNTILQGSQGPRPLLIAHGLFGSARNWGAISKRLSDARPVISVDMRNHGASEWKARQTYHDMADDLAEVIRAHGGQADVLGHSMGGKAAMVLALAHPELVGKLIVADIAPVAYGHTQAHLIEAMRKVDLSLVMTRGDADRQLAEHVNEAAVRAFLLQSLDLKGACPQWRLNLDALESAMADILGFPDIAGRFDGPALFLSGGASDYVQPKDHDQIRDLFPNATFQQIAGAGHWLHAEKPREFEGFVRAFLCEDAVL